MIREYILLLTLLVTSTIATAGVVKVDLDVGEIQPGQTIVIHLDALMPNHTYILSCALTSNHLSGNPYDIVEINTPTNSSDIGLTAEETKPGSHQYRLPTHKNGYLYGNISKEIGDISITNLDNTDTILLSSCHAVGRV